MDRKTLGIAVLTITAVLLAGVVVQGLKPTPAEAQAGRFADYALLPVRVAGGNDELCVLDTTTERMLFFKYSLRAKALELAGQARLREEEFPVKR